ncbi:MAG TPA: hypothetical protein PKZ25_16250, partial [Candidatus Hydrogenedentes bacterium]|nr:hypothetical protein [Candidatus Hydrogenedentota bacterium]
YVNGVEAGRWTQISPQFGSGKSLAGADLRLNAYAGETQQRIWEEVDRAAERATTLVRQLLTFARREKLEQTPLDLNEVVSGLIKMIRRLIGEHIEMVFEPGPGDVTVFADRGQV